MASGYHAIVRSRKRAKEYMVAKLALFSKISLTENVEASVENKYSRQLKRIDDRSKKLLLLRCRMSQILVRQI